MIDLNDLHFTYAKTRFELTVKRLHVPHGQRCCWVGPSGCGKTTLLNLGAGILAPARGKVTTCGEELTALPEAARRDFRIANIGLVFQDFALLDYLSVLENILLPYRISRALKMGAAERLRAEQLATDLGLYGMLRRRPSQLSQGERQRVAVCRAIVTQPKLLLADEPTANLDAANANRVLSALEEYAVTSKATLVVVSHDSEVIARFPDTIEVPEICAPAAISGGEVDHA